MSLILVRHTTPDIGKNICYGRTDMGLATSFDQEAAKTIAALPAAARLVSSPLRRCRYLAEAIGEARGLSVQFDDRLREMDFGTWEGTAWDALPEHELMQWMADFMHARPHGGESVHMLRERTRAVLQAILETGDKTIVVTHSGVIRSALSNGDSASAFNTNVSYGQVVEVSKELKPVGDL